VINIASLMHNTKVILTCFNFQESVNQSSSNLLTLPWIKELVTQDKLYLHGGYYDFVEGYLNNGLLVARQERLKSLTRK
jgi:hypothetical protein